MELEPPIPLVARTSLRVPLVSATVEAGFPSPAEDFIEKGLDLNEELIRNPNSTFCVRVKGESMNDAGIHSGDVLIVDKSLQASDRQIVVAQINGDFTVKRLRKNGRQGFPRTRQFSFPSHRSHGHPEDLNVCVASFAQPARTLNKQPTKIRGFA